MIRRPVRHDTTPSAPRHGAQCATRWRSVRHDMALSVQRARGLGTVRAQPGPWVCALCTQPSFDSVHYLQSLFGSLFIDTVHEFFFKK